MSAQTTRGWHETCDAVVCMERIVAICDEGRVRSPWRQRLVTCLVLTALLTASLSVGACDHQADDCFSGSHCEGNTAVVCPQHPGFGGTKGDREVCTGDTTCQEECFCFFNEATLHNERTRSVGCLAAGAEDDCRKSCPP